jgi:RNA polymerase sigma factor (sigma-70 family)
VKASEYLALSAKISAWDGFYFYNERYDTEEAEAILGFQVERKHERVNRAEKEGTYELYNSMLKHYPVLTWEGEIACFHQFNCAKHKAAQIRANTPCLQLSDLDNINYYFSVATKARNELVTRNLRLVVAASKKYVQYVPAHETISFSHETLMRAAEKFDVNRGWRFSTYATNAIFRNLARFVPNYFKEQKASIYGPGAMHAAIPDEHDYEAEADHAMSIADEWEKVSPIIESMSERHQAVLRYRYGIGTEKLTLEETGRLLGVTKERIRQIECYALKAIQTQLGLIADE